MHTFWDSRLIAKIGDRGMTAFALAFAVAMAKDFPAPPQDLKNFLISVSVGGLVTAYWTIRVVVHLRRSAREELGHSGGLSL